MSKKRSIQRKASNRSGSPTMSELLKALEQAIPMVLAAHFDGPKACLPMSAIVESALKNAGVTAKILQVYACYHESDTCLIVGSNTEERLSLVQERFSGVPPGGVTFEALGIWCDLDIQVLRSMI